MQRFFLLSLVLFALVVAIQGINSTKFITVVNRDQQLSPAPDPASTLFDSAHAVVSSTI